MSETLEELAELIADGGAYVADDAVRLAKGYLALIRDDVAAEEPAP